MSSRTRPPAWESEYEEQDYYDDEPVRTRGRRPPPRRPMRKVALPIVGLAAAGGLLVGFLANSGGGGTVTTTVTATRTVTAPPAAADTASGPATRATIALAVLNGSGEAGLAGTTAEQARSLGYEDVTEGNAPTPAQADRVLFRQGAEAEASQVATDLALPDPVPAAGDEAAAVEPDAKVIVVLGPS